MVLTVVDVGFGELGKAVLISGHILTISWHVIHSNICVFCCDILKRSNHSIIPLDETGYVPM
jgi:hypothetical protein